MDRRTFVQTGAAATGAALLHPSNAWSTWRSRDELVLRGAVVYDGTGSAPTRVDVAISGDRISAVGANLRAPGQVVDLSGLALAPGFIDIHSHTDLALLVNARGESKVRQGVTTEVTGQDGGSIGPMTDAQYERTRSDYRQRYGVEIDFRDLPGFFRRLTADGAALNVASMIGHGTVRGFVVGEDDRPATAEEITRMARLVEEALAAGACGLSSGLEYTPGAFADTAELAALAVPLRARRLPYSSHMRNEDDRLFAAVEEAIQVGSRAGVRVQISHLKQQGERNWWKAEPILRTIEGAHEGGIDVAFDAYPYIAYSTGLSNLFPVSARDGGTEAFLGRLQDPARQSALRNAVQDKIDQLGSWDAVQITSTNSEELRWAAGRRLGELAKERGQDPMELLWLLMIQDRARPGMVGFGMSEENVEKMLAHPLSVVCSDAGARATYGPLSEGSPHPRTYGAFPRVLGHYVRDRKIMPLETAIRKMTSMPAERLGFSTRGRIAPRMVADLVAFDPVTVADRATFESPHQYPVGIPHVLVGGKFVLRNGEQTGALPGGVVRPG